MLSAAQFARRVVNGTPALRAVADTRLAQDLIQGGRAARVLEPHGRFALNQLHRGRTRRYRLPNGAPVHLRHRTRDVDIVAEIFAAGVYEPPAALPLAGPLRVLDLGGNVGLFGAYALQRWDVTWLRSFEPDAGNARLLHATALPYGQWDVVEAAVSNAPGEMRFVTGRFSESRAAREGEDAISVPVVDLFDQPPIDLLKMDIEGGEWPILTDPRLADLSARAVVMEWHAGAAPGPDAGALAARLLHDAGFAHHHHEPGRFDSNGMLWAWR